MFTYSFFQVELQLQFLDKKIKKCFIFKILKITVFRFRDRDVDIHKIYSAGSYSVDIYYRSMYIKNKLANLSIEFPLATNCLSQQNTFKDDKE